MNNTLYYLSDWQTTHSSLADRYHIERNTDLYDLQQDSNINADFFLELIALFNSEKDLPVDNLKNFPVTVILDYLEKTHQYYINTKLPEIEQSVVNLYRQMPENASLHFLLQFFEKIKSDLIYHINKEENKLFPYIKSLVQEGLIKDKSFTLKHFTENHTDEVENYLNQIKIQIVRSQQTAEELFPYRVLLRQLDTFEKDLRIHARIEDEVLIPLGQSYELRIFSEISK